MHKNFSSKLETNTELFVHGHSSLEIRRENFSLICDPWLLGSAYWRSWWNFPKQTDLLDLERIWRDKKYFYIYITHLHWDHFHGPTLRYIIKQFPNVKIIIPKTPEKRLKKDLYLFINKKNIIELTHGEKIKLHDDISILSFQVGVDLADSIISIFNQSFNIVNINDAKILPLSRKHFLSLVPKPNYVFRSHSSANSRCCLRDLKGEKISKIFDKKRLDYSIEFFDTCYELNADYAIPFASNMACLHKDTFQYNSILNFSDYVLEDFEKYSNKYNGMNFRLLLPSEKLNLESSEFFENKILRKKLKSKPRVEILKEVQDSYSDILKKQYLLENKTKLSFRLFNKYFIKIINLTPLPLRYYLSNNIIFNISSNNKVEKYCIDFLRKSVYKIKTKANNLDNVNIFVNSYVINDICKQSHYTSLGVSKRLEVWIRPSNNRYKVFNLLCNAIENDAFFPLKKIYFPRYFLIWLRRYREILDIIFYLTRSLILKIPTFRLK